MTMPRAQSRRVLRRFPREVNPRLAARLISHFNVPPSNAAPPSRPQRLHRRFFRGKSCRIALKFRLMPLAVPDFRLGEQALQKRSPETRNCRFNAVDLRNVRAHSNDHLFAPRSRNLRVHYNGKG